MATSLRGLVATLLSSRESILPSIQAFPPLDIDQVAREINLEERAAEAGKLGQPSSDSTGADLAELDVLSAIERRARKDSDDYRSQLELYEGRIRRALITADQRARIEAAGQTALADFKAQTQDDLNHLHVLRTEVEGREEEFQAFRQKHRLERLPTIVTDRAKLARYLFLGILVVFESVLNGMFFAEGSETGLIGGVTQALVLSLLNVGGAVGYAVYGLPLLYHRQLRYKLAGVAATVSYVLFVLLLNLVIAHFRDLFVSGIGQVKAADIEQRLAAAPLTFTDAKSWLLGMLGLGLSLTAVIDASGLEDTYPGYGAVGRRREAAIARYAEARSRCFEGLQGLRNVAIEDMGQVIEMMRSSQYDLQLAVEGRTRLFQNYRADLDHLATAHEHLLRRYREANVRTRTIAAPTYFVKNVARPLFLEIPVLNGMPEMRQDARTAVIRRMEHYIRAVNQAFEEALPRYQRAPQPTDDERPTGATS